MPTRRRDAPPSPRAFLALVHRHYREVRAWARGVVLICARRVRPERTDADRPDWLRLLDDRRPLTQYEADAFAYQLRVEVSRRMALDPARGGPPAWATVSALTSLALPLSRLSAVRALAELRRVGIPPALAAALFGESTRDPTTGLTVGAVQFGVVDPLTSPAVRASIDAWAREARDYITAIPQQEIADLPQWVAQVATEGRSWRDLARTVEDRIGVSERHAELVARDQVAKLNARITEEMHTAAGITEYRWITGRDDRVRETHREAALGGPYRWGDLSQGAGAPNVGFYGERGHPGQAGQCRCTAEPVPPAWWREVELAASRADARAVILSHVRRVA
jgi:SPP1 gp7 family putative phage head morphogenesis protein